jgi:thiamine biosynthesis lipoprotein
MILERRSRTVVAMDTIVTATVTSNRPAGVVMGKLDDALRWFGLVEAECSRFEPGSEVSRLAASAGVPIRIGPITLAAVRIALTLAEASGGAFDPTVGGLMEERGYDRNYRTGERICTPVAPAASWRDVDLDPEAATIRLRRPLLLDLGAVAKGLAVDLTMAELASFPGAIVEAGGDLRVHGSNERGEPWSVGVRGAQGRSGMVLTPGDAGVCTSAGYARPAPDGGHHLLDPRRSRPSADALSATVIAPTCAAADALATAAFVLGPARGIELLEREGVQGLISTRRGSWHTRDFEAATDAA